MKNWKFIKIGNDATGPNWDKKRQLEDELRGWMATASKATGEEKQNAEKQIADIRKELNDVKIKIAHGENKKAGNESIDKQEWSMFKGLAKDAEKEVGNAGEGWYTFVGPKQSTPKYREGQQIKTREGKGTVTKVQPMKLSGTPTYKVKLESGKEIWLYEEEIGNKKLGNETAEEKKFGKVMREFDRGELKSSSGETVTNPEQAKAIAYSESEKVDNLKRARNSMTKNSQITLWNGNDSVLISENGLVQYLENNSFETDRAKYDSQEKAVEELTKKGYHKK